MFGKIFEIFSSWYMHQNVLGQSDRGIFKSTVFLEQNDGKVCFLHVDTNSLKLEVHWKILDRCGYKWVCLLWLQKSKIGLFHKEIN